MLTCKAWLCWLFDRSGAGRTCYNWHLSLRGYNRLAERAPSRFNLQPRGLAKSKGFIYCICLKIKRESSIFSSFPLDSSMRFVLDCRRDRAWSDHVWSRHASQCLLLPDENHKEILWTYLKVVMHMTWCSWRHWKLSKDVQGALHASALRARNPPWAVAASSFQNITKIACSTPRWPFCLSILH